MGGAHDVVTTSMRRNDIASTSFRRRVPTRLLINQCQIITFLILKYDIIQHSRIELRGIVLPVQVGGLLGGPKGMLPPLSNYWGGLAPPGPPLFLRLCGFSKCNRHKLHPQPASDLSEAIFLLCFILLSMFVSFYSSLTSVQIIFSAVYTLLSFWDH